MIDIKRLEEERNKAYDVWFERWWSKSDVEKQIKLANCQGYTGYVLRLGDYHQYEQRRMSKDRFLLKLQEMLPRFEVEFRYNTNWLTKKDYLYGIYIDWS